MIKSSFEQQLKEQGQLIYTCRGGSMLPLLRQKRDLVIIDRKTEARCRAYDVPLYRRKDGQYVLHRVLEVGKKDYVMCGDNCWEREYGITDNQIIGVLSGFVRNGKRYSSKNPWYRLYVHVWCDFFWIRAASLRLKERIGKCIDHNESGE